MCILWIRCTGYVLFKLARNNSNKQLLKSTNNNKYLWSSSGNDSLHRPNPWEFLINKKHKIIWCNVFKAASSSWMYNFAYMAGASETVLRNPKSILLNVARAKYPRPSWQEVSKQKMLKKMLENKLSNSKFSSKLSCKMLWILPQHFS